MDENIRRRVAELADRYGRSVCATAYRILGDLQDAEDVLQQVFLKLLGMGNGESHPPVRDWHAYLCTMASRMALDLLRAKRQRHRRAIPLLEEVADRHEQAGSRANEEQVERLRQAITALPERDARVFCLRYFEEFSYEAIAEQTGLSVDLIGVILHRSRQSLREAVKRLDVPE